MSHITANRIAKIRRLYRRCPIDCPMYSAGEISNLGDFFSVFASLLDTSKIFWFRGHPSVHYALAPSALRYGELSQRNAALSLISEMKRFMEMKLPSPPAPHEHLAWMQIAQHYGLPTRLLDWTQNAAVALFFACSKDLDDDGLVVVLNPIELNQVVDPRSQRIFTTTRDSTIIDRYCKLDGSQRKNGCHTIAINPTWNNERIAMQQGAFTLHGNRHFVLDKSQASSLVYVPILREHKEKLLNELHRVGIGEMFIYPEPEHVCAHLRRMASL